MGSTVNRAIGIFILGVCLTSFVLWKYSPLDTAFVNALNVISLAVGILGLVILMDQLITLQRATKTASDKLDAFKEQLAGYSAMAEISDCRKWILDVVDLGKRNELEKIESHLQKIFETLTRLLARPGGAAGELIVTTEFQMATKSCMEFLSDASNDPKLFLKSDTYLKWTQMTVSCNEELIKANQSMLMKKND